MMPIALAPRWAAYWPEVLKLAPTRKPIAMGYRWWIYHMRRANPGMRWRDLKGFVPIPANIRDQLILDDDPPRKTRILAPPEHWRITQQRGEWVAASDRRVYHFWTWDAARQFAVDALKLEERS